jgi:hypothetical protein
MAQLSLFTKIISLFYLPIPKVVIENSFSRSLYPLNSGFFHPWGIPENLAIFHNTRFYFSGRFLFSASGRRNKNFIIPTPC